MPRKKVLTSKQFADQATGIRLSSHEKLCAYRMKEIHNSIKELSSEVKSLRQDVLKGKGAISTLIILGSIIAAVAGYFKFNG